MDLCGPMSEESLGANKYFFLLFDDYSRWFLVYFLRNKSKAFQKFLVFHAIVEKQTGLKLKAMRIERGGEFSSVEFQKYYEALGIKRQFTAGYTPQ